MPPFSSICLNVRISLLPPRSLMVPVTCAATGLTPLITVTLINPFSLLRTTPTFWAVSGGRKLEVKVL